MSNDNDTPLIGQEKPKGKMMSPQKAIFTLSVGFLKTMEFLQDHGIPPDVMLECMRIGEFYGCVRRTDSVNLVSGKPQMQFEYSSSLSMLMAAALMTKIADRKRREIKETGTCTMSEEDKHKQRMEVQAANEEMNRAPRAYPRRMQRALSQSKSE